LYASQGVISVWLWPNSWTQLTPVRRVRQQRAARLTQPNSQTPLTEASIPLGIEEIAQR